MKKLSILSLVILTLLFSLSSCTKLSRQNVMKIVEETKKGLPSGNDYIMVDVNIKNDMVEFTYKLTEDGWRDMRKLKGMEDSEEFKAMEISSIDDETIRNFIDSDYGIKNVYYLQSTGKNVMTVEIPSSELADLYKKKQSGEIKVFSLLDMLKMEVEQTEYPVEMGEEICVSEGYVDGNNICYTIKIDKDMDKLKSKPDYDELMRGLSREVFLRQLSGGFYEERKADVLAQNIHYVYIIKDSRDKEYYRVDFGPKELISF